MPTEEHSLYFQSSNRFYNAIALKNLSRDSVKKLFKKFAIQCMANFRNAIIILSHSEVFVIILFLLSMHANKANNARRVSITRYWIPCRTIRE